MAVDREGVLQISRSAPIRHHDWKDRGHAPAGYVDGMAVAFADAYVQLRAGDPVAAAIADKRAEDPQHDVLDWYADLLAEAGTGLQTPSERMVGVFVVLLGLGMRESSGSHCEGRDQSADNTTAETAEAGLFQVSHNSVRAHPLLQPLFDAYLGREDLLDVFSNGVQCSVASWTNWGDGAGRSFQALTKRCPKFAVLYAALLLRRQRKHWGPINTRKAEVRVDAVSMFRAVQALVEAS